MSTHFEPSKMAQYKMIHGYYMEKAPKGHQIKKILKLFYSTILDFFLEIILLLS